MPFFLSMCKKNTKDLLIPRNQFQTKKNAATLHKSED
jgi:hypothetical protein